MHDKHNGLEGSICDVHVSAMSTTKSLLMHVAFFWDESLPRSFLYLHDCADVFLHWYKYDYISTEPSVMTPLHSAAWVSVEPVVFVL